MEHVSETDLREAWLLSISVFRKAEYAIKICEHLSTEPSGEAFEALRQSSMRIVAALQEKSPQIVIKTLNQARGLAKQAMQDALVQGMSLLAARVANILHRYSADRRRYLAAGISKFNEHEANVNVLKKLLHAVSQDSRLIRKEEFIEECQNAIVAANNFLLEYSLKAKDIDKRIKESESHRWKDTYGQFFWALLALPLGIIVELMIVKISAFLVYLLG